MVWIIFFNLVILFLPKKLILIFVSNGIITNWSKFITNCGW